jgi:hypothetical protein
MNKYEQSFKNISEVSENSNYDDKNLIAIDLHVLRELINKHKCIKEYLKKEEEEITSIERKTEYDIGYYHAIKNALDYLDIDWSEK